MDEVKNYPPYLDYPKPYKPQTNTDYIRAMSEEEALAASKRRMFMAFPFECPVCGHKTNMSQTNADKIRAMSDEELAEFLSSGLKEPCDCCQLAVFEGACTETLCEDAMMKWLQQPSKGE